MNPEEGGDMSQHLLGTIGPEIRAVLGSKSQKNEFSRVFLQ